LQVYFGEKTPLPVRVNYVGFILTFFFAWKLDLERRRSLLKTCFVTLQAFRGVLITTNTWLNLYRLFRDVCPSTAFDIRSSGTDICETKFSSFGGFGEIEAGRRNFTFGEALASAQKLNKLASWEGDREKGGLVRKRRHHKQEHQVLAGDETEWESPANLTEYLPDKDISTLLQAGAAEALAQLEKLGLRFSATEKTKLYKYETLNFKDMREEPEDDGLVEQDSDADDAGPDVVVGATAGAAASLAADAGPDTAVAATAGASLPRGAAAASPAVGAPMGTAASPAAVGPAASAADTVASEPTLPQRGANAFAQHEATRDWCATTVSIEGAAPPLPRARDHITVEDLEAIAVADAMQILRSRKDDLSESQQQDDLSESLQQATSGTAEVAAPLRAVAVNPTARVKLSDYVTIPAADSQVQEGPQLIHKLKLLSRCNAWAVQKRPSYDRLTKIQQAASGTISSHTPGFSVSQPAADAVQPHIHLGEFVAVSFWEDSAPGGIRFWIGRVASMTSRPAGRAAKQWFRPVLLSAAPKDLWLTCEWLEPVPSDSSNEYTTLLFKGASSPSVIRDKFVEVSCKHVILVPLLSYCEQTKLFRLSQADLDSVQRFLSILSAEAQAVTRAASRPEPAVSKSKPSRAPSASKRAISGEDDDSESDTRTKSRSRGRGRPPPGHPASESDTEATTPPAKSSQPRARGRRSRRP